MGAVFSDTSRQPLEATTTRARETTFATGGKQTDNARDTNVTSAVASERRLLSVRRCVATAQMEARRETKPLDAVAQEANAKIAALERENARLKLEIARYATGEVEARGANVGAEALPKKSFSVGPRLQWEDIAHEVEDDDVFVVWG